MAVTRNQKEQILADLTDKFGRAKGVVFAQNRGLSVEHLQALRKGLRAANVDFKVAKKTLITLAAKEHGIELPKDMMEGPIAVAFGFDDEIVAAQKMSELTKSLETVALMGGVFEGKAIDAAMVKQLSSIPPREVLLATLLATMQGPASAFARLLKEVPAAFARVTNAYKEKLEKEGPAVVAPAPAAEEPTA